MRIAILDDWQGVAESWADWGPVKDKAEVVFFRENLGAGQAAINALKDFDAIQLLRERMLFTAEMLDQLPKLKLICITGGPPASLNIAECTKRGVVVCGTQLPGPYPPTAVAELVMGMIIGAMRAIPEGDAAIRAGGFQESLPVGRIIEGQTLGVVGVGQIGKRVARYAEAFGMKVIGWSQNLTEEQAKEAGIPKVSKEELFSTADVITVQYKLSDRSVGIVGAEDIARMKPGALLVNTSRGPLVDEAAMLKALQEGRIRAALDVFDDEPLPPGHPIRTAPGTLLLPHLGYVTTWAFDIFYPQTAENMAAWLNGAPIRVMNKDVLNAPLRA